MKNFFCKSVRLLANFSLGRYVVLSLYKQILYTLFKAEEICTRYIRKTVGLGRIWQKNDEYDFFLML